MRHVLHRYQAIAVFDDDIVIDTAGINALFAIREAYKLDILQPAMRYPLGKADHSITRQRPWVYLRYTDFVEMTCPLFRREVLEAFMGIYEPSVSGWGVDLWFLEHLRRQGQGLRGKVAIVDSIACLNPHDSAKGGSRAMDQHSSLTERIHEFDLAAARYGIPGLEQRFHTFRTLYRPWWYAVPGLWHNALWPRIQCRLPGRRGEDRWKLSPGASSWYFAVKAYFREKLKDESQSIRGTQRLLSAGLRHPWIVGDSVFRK